MKLVERVKEKTAFERNLDREGTGGRKDIETPSSAAVKHAIHQRQVTNEKQADKISWEAWRLEITQGDGNEK